MKHTTLVPLKSIKRYPLDEMQRRADEFYRDLDRRRTIRDFKDDPVPRNVIENCLKAADTAPSGANQHPWHFVVVEDQEIKSEIRLWIYVFRCIFHTNYKFGCSSSNNITAWQTS